MAGRRILLLHVTTSSGHHHASQAIAQALRRLDPDCQIINVDAFDYTSRFVRFAIQRSYHSLIRHQPNVWEYLYDNPAIHAQVRQLRRLLHRYHTNKLRRLIETVQPHAIACTQAFPCGMLADFKQQQRLDVPLVSVLTDYAPHLYWLHEQVTAYVVPAEELKARFISYHVPEDRIHVHGIPVEPSFLEPVDRETVYDRFHLRRREPLILVMGGGGGFGPVRELMRSLDQVHLPCQFVVLAGTNHALLSWLRQQSFRHHVVSTGYVESVPELMEIASLIISKPGGLTTAETLTKRLPMLMSSPIPGQEMCNARFLLAHDAAVQLTSPASARDAVQQLLQQPDRLAQLRRNAGRLAYPESAFHTARLLVELADRTIRLSGDQDIRISGNRDTGVSVPDVLIT